MLRGARLGPERKTVVLAGCRTIVHGAKHCTGALRFAFSINLGVTKEFVHEPSNAA